MHLLFVLAAMVFAAVTPFLNGVPDRDYAAVDESPEIEEPTGEDAQV